MSNTEKDKEIYGLSKVPDKVIIKTQQEEIQALKAKNHSIVEKAKEREEQWKAYADELLNTIRILQEEESDEDKKAIKRMAKAQKKAMADYNQILEQNRKLNKDLLNYKREIAALKADLEGRPIEKDGPSRLKVRKAFNSRTDRRVIMDAMGYPYNESFALNHNAILFIEWVRANAKWLELNIYMQKSKNK